MNKELIEALEILEKEKNISSFTHASERNSSDRMRKRPAKADNVKVNINPTTGDFAVLASKEGRGDNPAGPRSVWQKQR